MSPVEENQKKGSVGCLGYGCVVAAFLLVLILGLVFLYVLSSFRGAVDKYTAPTRPAFEVVEADSTARSSSVEKLSRLAALLRDPAASGTETLSGAEVTAALQSSFGPRLEVRFVGGAFEARFALPLSDMYQESFWPRLLLGSRGERFAVGEAQGRLALKRTSGVDGGSLEVVLSRLSLNGHDLEGDALVRASEWFSGWATSEVNAPSIPEVASRPSLAGRLAGLEISGDSLVIGVEPLR